MSNKHNINAATKRIVKEFNNHNTNKNKEKLKL